MNYIRNNAHCAFRKRAIATHPYKAAYSQIFGFNHFLPPFFYLLKILDILLPLRFVNIPDNLRHLQPLITKGKTHLVMVVTLSNCQVWAPDNTEATTISKPADNTVKVITHSNRTAIRKPAAKLRHVQTQHVTLVNVLVVLVPEPRKLANSLEVNAESNVLCLTLVQTVTEHVSNVTILIERAIHPFSVLRPLALKSNRPHFYKFLFLLVNKFKIVNHNIGVQLPHVLTINPINISLVSLTRSTVTIGRKKHTTVLLIHIIRHAVTTIYRTDAYSQTVLHADVLHTLHTDIAKAL
nr:MAG TPA: hypothetical protein [Caudoviricetes sp.]